MRTVQSTLLRKTLFKELRGVSLEREPVQILRHGKPIAVLVPAATGHPASKKPLIDLDAIASFCRGHHLRSLSLFGSVLREDFDEGSDVDIMVDSGGRFINFHELCSMNDELEIMFGRKVDLVIEDEVKSPGMHKMVQDEILSTAREFYHEAA